MRVGSGTARWLSGLRLRGCENLLCHFICWVTFVSSRVTAGHRSCLRAGSQQSVTH